MVLKQELKGIEKKFFEMCQKVVSENDLSLYDMDYIQGSSTLRLYILDEETGTAQLDDCVKIDRALTPYFEEEEWIPETITLEVSSPGLYRQLNRVDHFERVKGQDLSVVLKKKLSSEEYPELPKSLEGQKKFIARLNEVDEKGLRVKHEEFELNLLYEEIKKANLEADLKNVM